jgi:hypothetical protein
MRILSLVVLCSFACSFGYAPELKAADARMYSIVKKKKASKRHVRVAYVACRTGWWRAYCDGAYRPRWGTWCRY